MNENQWVSASVVRDIILPGIYARSRHTGLVIDAAVSDGGVIVTGWNPDTDQTMAFAITPLAIADGAWKSGVAASCDALQAALLDQGALARAVK